MPFRLAILTTHPIQYYAPLFKILAAESFLELKVFYTLGGNEDLDAGFGKNISWDIPLLEGYEYEFLTNSAKVSGSHHFAGIQNPDVISRINDFAPDGILVYGWSYLSHLKIIRYFEGKIPVWFRGDSTLIDPSPIWKKLIRMQLLKWVYKHIDLAFYVGQQNKAYFKAYGLKEDQLIFAPHAVDNERFGIDRSEESLALRKRLNVMPHEILILFAGKFEDKKDPLILTEAFIKLNKASTHLFFVGNGFLEKELKEKVIKQAQDNKPLRIHFLDFQNQSKMPVIYQACDLFCMPSKGPNETWGLAVNEAMASGKAVLVSDKTGCAADLVEDQKNGYIFESGNLTDLTNKLDKLTNDNQQLKDMGEYSKKLIQKWSFLKQVEVYTKQIRIA